MRKEGNGNPLKCIENLLATVRGEVPYSRIKGINGRIIDMQADVAKMELDEDARYNIDTFEPRVSTDDIEIAANINEHGEYTLTAYITESEEEI